MPKKLETLDPDNPPLKPGQIRRGKRLNELPPVMQQLFSKRTRGPQKSPTKERISILLSQDVTSGLRATGKGWQARVDEILRVWLKKNGTAA